MRISTFFYFFIFSLCLESGVSLRAMDHMSHEVALRVATSAASLGLGYCIESTALPSGIKAPLYGALCLYGAYGIGWHQRPFITDSASRVLSLASLAVAASGTWYHLMKSSIGKRNKAHILSALYAVSLWRLCKSLP